jgi:phosphatidylserine decarboxylase
MALPSPERKETLRLLREAVLVPVHREGWPFAGGAAALGLAGAWFSPSLGVAGIVLAAAIALFFRDPPRATPVRDGLIVSPGDGRITAIGPAAPPPELVPFLDDGGAPRLRVSIFLSLFDVHINRAPAGGTVVASAHQPGRFLNAADARAGAQNERHGLVIRTAGGRHLVVVQIAGLLARRIVTWTAAGDSLQAGQRFGLIRFGSRVDLYLPEGVAPLVAVGQRAVGGETVIADLMSNEPARTAEWR